MYGAPKRYVPSNSGIFCCLKTWIRSMMRKLLTVSLFCVAGFSAQPPVVASDPWKPLRFLIGKWEAKTTTEKVQETGTYSFQPELRDHVLVRRSSAGPCKGPADFDCEHSDVLYVYVQAPGQPYKAIYFDNEGHVIHYDVTAPTATSAIFLSDGTQPGPQFRLSYQLKDGVMVGKFQMKPPGQSDFRSYLEWRGGRK
jgi:hypothetical protein